MVFRKQYKIFAIIGVLLLLTTFIYNKYLIVVIGNLRWQINYHVLEDYSDLEKSTLPNFQDEEINTDLSRRPWYMERGQVWPKSSPSNMSAQLLPDPRSPYNDRIHEQLMYIPPNYGSETPYKLILFYDYLGSWLPHEEGSKTFQDCPVNRCLLTSKKEKFQEADAVLFDDTFKKPSIPKSPGQVWIMYILESPLHSKEYEPADVFNWTITYRPDSDIPAPYGKWVYHGAQHSQSSPIKNFAANKTKKVAWFVSNCQAKNLRLEYAKELSKYIEVDVFGYCGNRKCPRSNENLCYKLLAYKYKFYLAFENSNCDNYITDKFFDNSIRNNVIPIVMGARRDDYEHIAPEGSYINVEDFLSPEVLAQYLHKLDKNDTLYNQYFLWRGTGEFINTKLFCRLCTMLHSKLPSKYYKDINYWWRDKGLCSTNF